MPDFTRRQFLQNAACAAGTTAMPHPLLAQLATSPLSALSLTEAAARIRRRELTSSDLVRALLRRIDEFNPGRVYHHHPGERSA